MAAGMDPERWFETRGDDAYSVNLKSNAMAWYRNHRLIEIHSEDASVRAIKPK